MMLMEVTDCPAVGHKMSLKAPVFPKNFLQLRAAAARFSVCAVICTHDGFHAGFLYKCLKRRKIRLLHILRCRLRIKLVAHCLRSGMYREMLRACSRLHRLTVTLQSLHKSDAKAARQIRVLPVRLMAAAPARIPENIYIRRPERQALVNVAVIFSGIGIVFRASLSRNDIRHLFYQIGVKGRCHADGLRENCCLTGTRHAMQSLIPPVVGRNAQTL